MLIGRSREARGNNGLLHDIVMPRLREEMGKWRGGRLTGPNTSDGSTVTRSKLSSSASAHAAFSACINTAVYLPFLLMRL